MKIIHERQAVLACLQEARATGAPVFCPNAETPDEMEGVLSAAQAFAEQHDLPRISVGLGITASYPDHPQLRRLDLKSVLTRSGFCEAIPSYSVVERALIWLDWIAAYARPSTFPAVQAIPFLDHGWASLEADIELMEHAEFIERTGIIMFDASGCELKENIALTRDYVRRHGGAVVVEGCPDKILSQADLSAKPKDTPPFLTDPETAAVFVAETGVDLIVPSLGTEHRGQPGEHIYYRRELARTLAEKVGPILALHGTSSLGDRLSTVAQDGICKVNFYTAMAWQSSLSLQEACASMGTGNIHTSCGSFVHRVRRAAVRETCTRMFNVLMP
ncbi:class II fructose-bisphosphate aldolase [Ruficoccus amylovorans]|uniref:Class II fructose-bisphosphate aldolase n=1 Tax=Ruficoccus amylovorans TaxID=1804625 RepID=A0A842HBG4_9BACT|nr:class II fructose-bisphosphate aldolase [Ruficoccus amylovorans]MBC2593803.1 class II fructose-bisphosphate aldolase [Ruficoccus amylovorans]